MELTSTEILLAAANLLEEEHKWCRGFYKITDKGCQMCAHTAIAYCGNAEVAQLINAGAVNGSISGVVSTIVDRGYRGYKTPLEAAHERAISVGLSYAYNDNIESHRDVVAKLREAAQKPE